MLSDLALPASSAQGNWKLQLKRAEVVNQKSILIALSHRMHDLLPSQFPHALRARSTSKFIYAVIISLRWLVSHDDPNDIKPAGSTLLRGFPPTYA